MPAKKKPPKISDKKVDFEERSEKLTDFLSHFFENPAHNFKVHKYAEGGFESDDILPEGTDVNSNTAFSVFTPKLLSQAQSQKQVLSFSPNIFRAGQTTTEQNLVKFNALFVDIDESHEDIDFTAFEFPPHYVFTRPNAKKYHLYWLIKPINATEQNRTKYLGLQKYFCDLFGGDPSTIKSVFLMRLPFTSHRKKNKISYYRIHQQSEFIERYNINDLHKALEHLIQPESVSLEEGETEKIVQGIVKDHRVVRQGEGRTNFIHYVGCLCYEWGIDQENAARITFEIQKEKCDPPEPMRHVETQMQKVYLHNKKDFAYKLHEYESTKSYQKRKKFLDYENHLGAIRNYLSNWVYVNQAELWINVDKNVQFTTRQQINAFLLRKFNVDDPWKVILKNGLIPEVDKITIEPEREQRIFVDENLSWFNRYKKIDTEFVDFSKANSKPAQRKAIAFFLNHLRYLIPEQKSRTLFIQYLAHLIQYPGKKIMWAPVVISDYEGIGKSILYKFFKEIFKSYVGNVENSVLNQKETDYLNMKYLIFVHEIGQQGKNKFEISNKLKSLVTDETVNIIAKYMRTYEQNNITNFILFGNNMDGLAISERSRRFLIIHNRKQKRSTKYYDRLAKVVKDNAPEIYSYLKALDISRFNPHKEPHETKAKLTMTALSKNETDLNLESLFESDDAPFDKPIIIIQNAMKVLSSSTMELKRGLSQKALRRFLLKNNYTERILKVDGKTRRLWSNEWGELDAKRDFDPKHIHNIVREIVEQKSITISNEDIAFE